MADFKLQLDQQADQIANLEAALSTERKTRAKEAAEDRKRLHDLETRIDETGADGTTTESNTVSDGGSEHSNPGVEPPQTPLEDIIRVPEHLVEGSLTANQRRARFVAKDIAEYTKQVPAGRALSSSELRRILAAGSDTKIYTQTVSRVIAFLDKLGEEGVKVRESQQGERIIVFNEGLVERVQTYRQQASNSVVTGREMES